MASEKKDDKKRIPKYEQIIAMDDNKINILILGTSGCGKSTLINAILEANEAPTGVGEAVTKEIKIYQNEELPFRMIDTVGYEYGLFRQNKIKHAIASFCKEGVKTADVEKLIHMIWFCIDGTTKRIDQEVLGYIKSVTNDWKNVPVFVVFTKSYSRIEIEENTLMANAAIEKYNNSHKKRPLNVKEIIPVVAKGYPIDDAVTVAPMGLDDLISKTIAFAPEAKQISESAIKEIDLKIKNAMANSLIGAATTGATAVGALPIPIPDATILVPIQSGMLRGVGKIYDIQDKGVANEIINTILKVGATTMAGKGLLSALKAIPGMNIAAAVLNAAVAGSITLAAGEISNILFKKAYTNEIDLKSVDWSKEVETLFKDYLPGIIEALKKLSAERDGKIDAKSIGEVLAVLAKTFLKENKGKTKKE
jgi:uncharacterized protein (DUF697 family)/GTP-binding protein EngB required for normal cell division